MADATYFPFMTTNPATFRPIMVAAYMEAGGNTLQRHLDGHPNLIHAPFETQLGNQYSSNALTSFYHFRYSYPVIPVGATPEEAYNLLFDEETKTYLRTRDRSKFRACGMMMDEAKRLKSFKDNLARLSWDSYEKNYFPARRRDYVEAYFRATYESWENYAQSGQETHFVGYYPLATVDADRFLSDFPEGHMIHIVRNPLSSYADTIKRPFALPLERYIQGWNIIQMYAANYRIKYPDRFHVIRFEDLVADKRAALEPILTAIGLPWSDACLGPSWNGTPMESIAPWGTIKQATTEANVATAAELTEAQRQAIIVESSIMMRTWGYLT